MTQLALLAEGFYFKGDYMTVIQELLEEIKKKNTWGKNELVALIAEVLARHTK